MKYLLPLESLRAATDTDRLMFAIAERLEHIAELMERAQGEIPKPYSSLERRRYEIEQDIIKRNMQS